MKLYKWLNVDGASYNGGSAQWYLPTPDGQPGAWMPAIEGKLVACVNGYHLCREADLVFWLGPVLWEAEYRGELIESDTKVVVREARLLHRVENWNERTARLFACDCAERFLEQLDESECDPHSVEVIQVARAYAMGEVTQEQLAAVRVAVRNAVKNNAKSTAWSAVRAIARDIAWSAARTSAKTTAWSVARTTAWSASWDASKGIVWGAARLAARAAAWEWQTERLMWYLEGGGASDDYSTPLQPPQDSMRGSGFRRCYPSWVPRRNV